ncbi:DUF805 domain-containing protein [Oceanicaulis sp. LC35]|uniref:DUF805 domain-containing protein n=1 Tax=Oceanicaulis sp. LC35 TaxID=3349635 RepID=UPI003F875A5D
MLIYHQLKALGPEVLDTLRLSNSPQGRAAKPEQRWLHIWLASNPALFDLRERYWRARGQSQLILLLCAFVSICILVSASVLLDLSAATFIALLLACLAAMVLIANLLWLETIFWRMRRLHDLGRSGLWAYLPQVLPVGVYVCLDAMAGLGPLVNGALSAFSYAVWHHLLGAYLVTAKGQSGPNRYGPAPEPLQLPDDMDASA